MSKFIMLSTIGMLTVFLLLNFLAVVGLNATVNTMEKNISIGRVNADIDYLNLQLNECDTALQLCKNVKVAMSGLGKMKLQKGCSLENIEASGLSVGEASHKIARCYEEKSKDCLQQESKTCMERSLLSFAECIAIAGRHLNLEFSEHEQDIYRQVLAMPAKDLGRGAIMKLSAEVLPVFSNTMFRIDEQLMLLDKTRASLGEGS